MNATLPPNDTDTSAREAVPAEGHAPGTDDVRPIALDRLLPSPENVRTLRPARDPADAQLVASIRTRGLLKNLVVVPADGQDGWFEVTAGERRRLAHLVLVADGAIAADAPVRCLVRSREQAVGDSLAENVGHKPMHPAERYV